MAVCCQNLMLGALSSHSVLTRLKFFVFDGSTCVSFNMLYHNRMNLQYWHWRVELQVIIRNLQRIPVVFLNFC